METSCFVIRVIRVIRGDFVILYTCNTCDTWRLRDFIRVIRVIRGDFVILYTCNTCDTWRPRVAIWDYHDCPSRAILEVNFTDMTICSTAIVYFSTPRLRGIRYGCSPSEGLRRLLEPPFAPLCLAPPFTPGSGVRVELDWS